MVSEEERGRMNKMNDKKTQVVEELVKFINRLNSKIDFEMLHVQYEIGECFDNIKITRAYSTELVKIIKKFNRLKMRYFILGSSGIVAYYE